MGELLCQIFQDKDLHLKFNYKDYSFRILTEGKEFKFTEVSDGYAAILDIVDDLILKMQAKDSLTRAYQKKGIVLIDEVETHLHLELQKMIMPFLTKVFPNIQFIITTHSPFVLNSLDNAVAFDLEHRETINEKKMRVIKEERFFDEAKQKMNRFLEKVNTFLMEPTPANRALVAAELSIEQEMLGFKYWVIRDNHLEAEFKDEIVWNKH